MVSDPIEQSIAFNHAHRIGEDQPIVFGMRDGGRHLQFGNDGEPVNEPFREIIVARNPEQDPVLKAVLAFAAAVTERFDSRLEKVDFLADLVAGLLSEGGTETVERNVRLIAALGGRGELAGVQVSLGDLIAARTGVCRHRSLLFKVLAEHCGIPCALVRGNYMLPGVEAGGHAWNEVVLENGDRFVVDVMNKFVADLADPELRNYATIEGDLLYRDRELPDHLPQPLDQGADQDYATVRAATWIRAQAFHGRGAYAPIEQPEDGGAVELVQALDRLHVRYDVHDFPDADGGRRKGAWLRGAYYPLLGRLGVDLQPAAMPAPSESN